MDPPEFPRFLEELQRVRSRFPGLTILAGVEADYVAGTEEYLQGFLSRWPLDLVLMSIHFVRTWEDPWWVFEHPPDRPIERVYDDYLDALQAGAETGLFDCVAHFDLIKQPGARLMETHRSRVERIVTICRDRGMSAEVNVSGIRKAVGEPFPSWDIVERMAALGLPLVPGADAHEPHLVGRGLETLAALRLVRYRGRRMLPSRVDAVSVSGA